MVLVYSTDGMMRYVGSSIDKRRSTSGSSFSFRSNLSIKIIKIFGCEAQPIDNGGVFADLSVTLLLRGGEVSVSPPLHLRGNH